MHIDSYSFGRMVVDGVEHEKDLKLYPDGIESNGWRLQGHLLQPDDLPELRDKEIDYLVVGQGAVGNMKIAEQTKKLLEELRLKWSVHPTPQAVEEYNRRAEHGERVAGVFHLTC